MLSLITDRTDADVARLSRILSTPKNLRTTEEQLEATSYSSKGAYNYTDLNRVIDAMEYVNGIFENLGFFSGYTPIKIDRNEEPEGLPDGYTELEYIESTGEQYIDTGFVPTKNNETVVCKFSISTFSGRALFGAQTNVGTFPVLAFFPNETNLGIYCGSTFNAVSVPVSTGEVYTLKAEASQGNLHCIVNEQAYDAKYSGDITGMPNTFLFGNNSNGSLIQSISAKIYSFAIYDDEQLRIDFIPSQNKLGEIGMYDLISHKFYKNAGSESFIAGPKKQVELATRTLDPYRWYADENISLQYLNQYIANLHKLRDTLKQISSATITELPTSIRMLSTSQANAIEQVLLDIEAELYIYIRRFLPCGATYCGGDYL